MVSRSFFFVHQRKLLHPPLESQPTAKATKQEHRPVTHRKAAPANRTSDPPKTERLNTMSAQRCLFSIPLYSRIHFKKSIVRKVCISTFIAFLLSMLSSFLLSWPVNNIVFAKFHARKTREMQKIQSNSIRKQIKELTLGRIRHNVC